ncbi:MAG: DUF5054 domain-containing protein [Gorillibacterium sp.]|nr:DUF5054 domain-containing protein [Gorillibacterium sp.]
MADIERVHVVFKTHLDIGFTNLAAQVTNQYMEEYIPKSIALSEQLEAEGGRERFIWTTGSWLIRHYLDHAPEEAVKRMERAIEHGHIAWHGLPFTTHTELLDSGLFRYGLSISQELDRQYGKQTIAAKMTDVPGHTVGIVPLMQEAGLMYLHIGVNPASMRPDVPRLFRWQAESGAEILVNYASNYGEALEIEGLKDVLLFAHTGDNCGPPTAEEIRQQFREIQSRYPGAEIIASTMDAFARRLEEVRHQLPILREEIGDTWIHGAGTDPLKLAKLRQLERLRSGWIEQGQLAEDSAECKGMSEAMLLVAEHTWGLDVKKWLPDFRSYAKADFQAARLLDVIDVHDVPAKFSYISAFAMDEFDQQSSGLFAAEESQRSYSMMEKSWAEQRQYLDQAVSALEPERRKEALIAFKELEPQQMSMSTGERCQTNTSYRCGGYELAFAEDGSISQLKDMNGKVWVDESNHFGGYVYETFGTDSYNRYFRTYMQNLPVTHPWADADFSKPGFEFVRPLPTQRAYHPVLEDLRLVSSGLNDRFLLRLRMPTEAYEQYGAPRTLELEYTINHQEGTIDVTLQWFGKDANRLPEASWFNCGLKVDNPNLWKMDKLGSLVSPLNVVKDGNRNLHAVDSGVIYQGGDGFAMIETLDAALAAPGQGRLLQFDNTFAPLDQGWHFNLHNNIWGTNFPMWYGEDAKFRFRLHLKSFQK